jgi:hypothetical protein
MMATLPSSQKLSRERFGNSLLSDSATYREVAGLLMKEDFRLLQKRLDIKGKSNLLREKKTYSQAHTSFIRWLLNIFIGGSAGRQDNVFL